MVPPLFLRPVFRADRADADALEALGLALAGVGDGPERAGEEAAVEEHLAPVPIRLVQRGLQHLLEAPDPVRVDPRPAQIALVRRADEAAVFQAPVETAPARRRAPGPARRRPRPRSPPPGRPAGGHRAAGRRAPADRRPRQAPRRRRGPRASAPPPSPGP